MKDKLTLGLSLAAFIFSSLSILLNVLTVLKKTDDLKMFVRDLPFIRKADESTLVIPATDTTSLIFINSGNRAAIVTNQSYVLRQYADAPSESCLSTDIDSVSVETDFKPIVVKPGEIVRTDVKVVATITAKETNRSTVKFENEDVFQVSIHQKLIDKKQGVIHLCIMVLAGTPEELTDMREFLITGGELGVDIYLGEERLLRDYKIPKQLIKSWSLSLP